MTAINRHSYNRFSLEFTRVMLKGHQMGRATYIEQHGQQAFEEREALLMSTIEKKEAKAPAGVDKSDHWSDFYHTINDINFNRRMVKKHGVDYENMLSDLAANINKPNTND